LTSIKCKAAKRWRHLSHFGTGAKFNRSTVYHRINEVKEKLPGGGILTTMTLEIQKTGTPAPDGQNYIFLMNIARLLDGDSYEVAPGYKLRRATPDEVTSIRNILKSSNPHIEFGPSPWESQLGVTTRQ